MLALQLLRFPRRKGKRENTKKATPDGLVCSKKYTTLKNG